MTDAWKWLQEVRGLDAERMATMGVRAEGEVFGVPYVRREKTYGWKKRKADTRDFWFQPGGAERHLWNVDVLDDQTLRDCPVIITEGEIDALSVLQSGFARVVSIPDGWTDGLEDGDTPKMRPLLEALDLLKQSPCVIVAGDGDSTGQSFVRAVANALEGHPVRHVEWPEGCKDANDVLVTLGESEIVARINAAKMVNPKGGIITGFSDLPPLGERRVLRAGYDPFDKFIAFEIGAMSVVTGIPGHGKSTFMTFAAHQVVRYEDIRVGMLALETHPHTLRDHLCLLNTGREWSSMSSNERRNLEGSLDRHWRLVHRTFDISAHALGWLKQTVQTLAVRDQCKMIVIDPWNELEHLPEPGESMTNYINFALREIRTWAERFDCHICVVAHPKKIGQDGKVYPPSGYDIADSAAFANKPSLGMSVFMDEGDDPHVKVRVWKVRNTRLYGFGKCTAKLDYDPYKMVYRRRA